LNKPNSGTERKGRAEPVDTTTLPKGVVVLAYQPAA
jgi:hypothetical protein